MVCMVWGILPLAVLSLLSVIAFALVRMPLCGKCGLVARLCPSVSALVRPRAPPLPSSACRFAANAVSWQGSARPFRLLFILGLRLCPSPHAALRQMRSRGKALPVRFGSNYALGLAIIAASYSVAVLRVRPRSPPKRRAARLRR